ncbi:uncharacterized protein LOC111117320 [Crassostrea virginica]
MPKRKSITGNAQRKKDAERKRQKRRESCHQLPPDEAPSESSAPHGDIGVAAPGPECGSIGLPPSTLKPLARVQASPSEKMHSAPRLAPPRGSRLIAPKRKVASPDSPAWVCAPARVPESDIWMMSDSAGQAQLIPPKGEMVSKALKKDVGPREGKKGPREGKKGPIQNTMKSNERTIKQKDKKIEQIEKIQKQNENTIEEIEKTEKQNEKTIEQIEKREKQNENTIEQIEKTEKQNEKTIEQIEKTEKQIEKSEKQKEKTIEQMEKTEKQNKKITEQIEKTEKQNGKAMEQIEKTEKQMEKTLRQKNDTIEQKEMINLSKSQTCSKITNVHDIIGSGYDALNVSVQGSFHQADAIFGETAGTQCVANSLTALAYQKVKMSEEWETRDMNKILTTGDEMYTFIQRSSSMANRYLLITELPQFFECYERMFEFKANESLPSLINLENIELNYADFNAYELFEALQIALDGTDGCFVCFGGNTFLVGKSGDTFFTFDSHSRSCEGFQSECGRSTRILYDSVQGVYNHIVFLALSMGFSAAVECEITGVQCSIRQFELETQGNTEIHQGQLDGEVNQLSNCTNPEDTTTRMTTIDSEDSDDIDITRIENASNMFLPLSAEEKEHICNILGISYAFSEESENEDMAVQDLTEPLTCVEIEPDGNCFFRAISMFLTKKQDFHQKIRSAVCSHLLENAMIFKSFLRLGECSVENHISLSGMSEVGNWATEVEILALSHLIKTDVYTYTGGRWVTYSGQMVNPHLNRESSSGIYLYHRNQNHYDVVTRVAPGEAISLQKPVSSCTREYRKRVGERNRKRQKRNPNKVCKSEDICRYDKNLLQKNTKYRMDPEFKLKLRAYTNKRYKENEQYRESLKESSSHKYKSNPSHKQDVKEKSKQKYKTNQIHKENMKSRSILKYRTDEIHKETLKQRSKLKYDTNELHKQDVKQRSKTKYRTDEQHQQKVKTASKTKYKTDEQHQQKVKTASKTKYKMDEQHQQKVKTASKTKYKTDEKHQQKVKTASKVKYHSSADSKEEVKKYVQKRRIAMQHMLKDIDEVVTSFKHSVKQGPEYTCCCCHRIFFENQVQGCAIETYEKRFKALEVANLCINTKYVHDCGKACPVKCPKSRTWICYTCHRKILNGDVPAEAAYNKMCLETIPPELNTLNTLEQHLIALHIPFMKVMMLPKGGQQNVHGPVVCVPSNLKKTTSLPLNANENLLLRVKLKRRLSYKGYYEYQFVNPNHIKAALNYLKENNKWYENVEINSTWEKDFDQSEFNQPEMQNEQLTEEDKDTNPEVVTDTCLQPVDIAQEVLDHYFDDVYNIAPGEGHNPIRMLQEEGNEAKTFPHLFPSGKFSWNDNRDVKISLSRYFNNRLMNADNRFAKDTNYIFFCQYLSELKQVIDKTQISIRKSVSKLDGRKPVTAEMLQNPEVLSKLLKTDEAMRFMQPIRGTPAYWSVTQKDLFAMLRQLGIPTWFCSFSAAEFRWDEIIGSILHQMNDDRKPCDLDWSEKSEILRSNPVTVARMFEHRFHIFQRNVIMSPAKPIGKIIDFFVRVEFQQRGSPHMHCLYWVENAPKLDEDSEDTICNFVDKYITCEIPSEEDDPELRQIVLDVQQHSKGHSKSCRKKGTECRFNFPRPPSECTFISRTVEEDLENSNDEKMNNSQAKDILLKVWNEVLDDVNASKTTEEIFSNINLTQNLYETAHRILASKATTILKRNPIDMWTNQYNPCLLKSWDANMDIQYVLDPFSCIVYIISYISKAEREIGMLLKQTQIEATEGNLSARDTIKRIGSAYLNHREVSAQEAVYRVCNLKMKESSRKVIFIPVGENPTRLSKPLAQIKQHSGCKIGEHKMKSNDDHDDDDDGDDNVEEEDMWMTNIVERYESRPKLNLFHKMCLAEFCSDYRVLAKSQIPKVEKEGVYELRNGKGYVQKRTRGQPAVIRYPRFNKESASEKYYQCLLQLFLPYWNVKHLKPPGFDLYETFYETGHIKIKPNENLQAVKSIVESNHLFFSKNEAAMENAQETLELLGEPEDAWARLCPETELNRRECVNEKLETHQAETNEPAETANEIDCEFSSNMIYHVKEPKNTAQEMLPLLRSLNEKQKHIFFTVHDWCVRKSCGENVEPMYMFVTGGAGTGKSHLIRTIHYEASRLLGRSLPSPSDISVILTAFTGTAAFNIGGNTIHHVFSLTKSLPIPYEPLKEQSLNGIRSTLDHLQILIIDEVSMVYKRLLYYIHERLVQVKKCKEPFGGVSIIAVGDFYQLPPVKQRKDERLYSENGSYPTDFWLEFFKIVKLEEIMRQREDIAFANVLNSLRIRTSEEPMSNEAKQMLRECIREGPEDALHVYSTNQEANEYNLKMLRGNSEELVELHAKDYQRDKTTGKLTLRDKPLIGTKADGLSPVLLLAVNARVMLTRNICVEDGLVNGAMGFISNFEYKDKHPENEVESVGVIFDSKVTGKIQGRVTPKGNLVQIKRMEEDLREKNSKSVVRHQFPLKLSWACTAHKVQGMTAKKVVVNLDRTFSPGQAYVAMSRVTSKDGLFIETNNETVLQKKIYADLDVKLALLRMQKYLSDGNFENSVEIKNHKSILLLNVQSLRAHFQEVISDSRLTSADLICLTETWLRGNENVQDIEIPDFDFHHITREQCYDNSSDVFKRLQKARGGGVGVYKNKTNTDIFINALECKNIEGMSIKIV